MNTNVWISQNFNYRENLKILKFWWFFLFLEWGSFDVKLITAKVVLKNMFFCILSSFIDNNWKKNNFYVLVDKNHDKWSNVSPVKHFCRSFDPANLLSFFPWFKFVSKIRFSIGYFYKYEHLKRFVWKDDVSAYKRKNGNRTHFPNRRWSVPSVDVRWNKNESVNIYFFRYFLTPIFNSRNIMIEPI